MGTLSHMYRVWECSSIWESTCLAHKRLSVQIRSLPPEYSTPKSTEVEVVDADVHGVRYLLRHRVGYPFSR